MLRFIVTLLCLSLLCKPFFPLTYYIRTVRRFDALHSHPLIIPPSLYVFHHSYMFHFLSCRYDTDVSMIHLMIADSPYCGHSIDSNHRFITMFYLIALGQYFRYIRTHVVPYTLGFKYTVNLHLLFSLECPSLDLAINLVLY